MSHLWRDRISSVLFSVNALDLQINYNAFKHIFNLAGALGERVLARQRRVMTQEPLHKEVSVSSSPAFAGFPSGFLLGFLFPPWCSLPSHKNIKYSQVVLKNKNNETLHLIIFTKEENIFC